MTAILNRKDAKSAKVAKDSFKTLCDLCVLCAFAVQNHPLSPSKSGKPRPSDELPPAGMAGDAAMFEDNVAAGDRHAGPAGDAPAFEHVVVAGGVHLHGADGPRAVWVEDDDVGIGADRDRALAWSEAGEPCRPTGVPSDRSP